MREGSLRALSFVASKSGAGRVVVLCGAFCTGEVIPCPLRPKGAPAGSESLWCGSSAQSGKGRSLFLPLKYDGNSLDCPPPSNLWFLGEFVDFWGASAIMYCKSNTLALRADLWRIGDRRMDDDWFGEEILNNRKGKRMAEVVRESVRDRAWRLIRYVLITILIVGNGLVIVDLYMGFLGLTTSQYASAAQGSDAVAVARFEIRESGAALSENMEIFLAPGECVGKTILVENKSEVAVQYTVSLENVTENLALALSVRDGDVISEGETYSGYLPAGASASYESLIAWPL